MACKVSDEPMRIGGVISLKFQHRWNFDVMKSMRVFVYESLLIYFEINFWQPLKKPVPIPILKYFRTQYFIMKIYDCSDKSISVENSTGASPKKFKPFWIFAYAANISIHATARGTQIFFSDFIRANKM